MEDGKKTVAEKVFYSAMDEIEKKLKLKPEEVFEEALNNASPRIEVVSRRVGGANYQIPKEVRPERKFYLAATWIINSSKSKSGAPLYKRLAESIINTKNNEGEAIKKKQDMHRMAEANRAFASFLR
jgi:small subunit ribosomal protein S7